MAIGLNLAEFLLQYEETYSMEYFVDKTEIIGEFIPKFSTKGKYICITRPRRFGKTVMAQMLAAYFSRGISSGKIFDSLKIAKQGFHKEHLNQYNVIYIDFSEMPEDCHQYEDYIVYIRKRLKKSLQKHYPKIDMEDSLWGILNDILGDTGEQFVFIMDEWDAIFQKKWCREKDREEFVNFLGSLLKDRAYVKFAYMTGVLPIKKYSSGSTLNMFYEYNTAVTGQYSEYFGFTAIEVEALFRRFLQHCSDINIQPQITLEELYDWYDGYETLDGERIFNPRSVVRALEDNAIGSYWTQTGPFSEVSMCIRNNVDAVREDIVRMVAGETVGARIQEFAANQMRLETRDEILSAMVVYGFLAVDKKGVRIPNRELWLKFEQALLEKNMGYVYRLAAQSQRMLRATLDGDTETMEEILADAHDTEVPVLRYNDEGDLAALVNLIYLAARDSYDVRREENTGKGRADVIFYPYCHSDPAMIVELKVDDTPENAIAQIKEKQYARRLKGTAVMPTQYTGPILAVGMTYDRKTKRHYCKVEMLGNGQ